ncbi:4285_t:CDS:1, partial [Acaulospora colombiana]
MGESRVGALAQVRTLSTFLGGGVWQTLSLDLTASSYFSDSTPSCSATLCLSETLWT